MNDTEAIIKAALSKFEAPRGQKFVHAGGRGMHVKTAGEKVLVLPNGVMVKITTDDSGTATQVEEDDRLHAVVRPATVTVKLSMRAEGS